MANEIVIYETPEKEVQIDVRLEKDTIWLNLNQISTLFATDKSGISRHIRNIYKTQELRRNSTVAKIATVQKEGNRNLKRNIDFYNLDMILSVGYRINSPRATQFRIWATNTLKSYFVHGYVLNEKRLYEIKSKFKELQNTVAFMSSKAENTLLIGKESEILHLLADYAKTLTLLESFDSGKMPNIQGVKTNFKLTYDTCKNITKELKKELTIRKEAGDLFGIERDNIFEGIIKTIYQTYDGAELYPNLEGKAANLLYLIIKDHPFSDGNKRIASFLFVFFLDKTNSLYKDGGEKRINDNALVALALLIAESNPKEKNILVNIIKNLISK